MNEERTTYVDIKLDVPHVSQYTDVTDADYRPVACGIACVYMTLAYFGAPVSTLDELIRSSMEEGGFSDAGWKHDHLCGVLQSNGYQCERREHMRTHEVGMIRDSVKRDNPVLVSVTRRMWDQRMFHIVLITGVRETDSGDLDGFFYHDPASLSNEVKKHYYVSIPTFHLDWRKMAIFPSRTQS